MRDPEDLMKQKTTLAGALTKLSLDQKFPISLGYGTQGCFWPIFSDQMPTIDDGDDNKKPQKAPLNEKHFGIYQVSHRGQLCNTYSHRIKIVPGHVIAGRRTCEPRLSIRKERKTISIDVTLLSGALF